METVLFIGYALAMAMITQHFAEKQGRNKWLGFFVGLFFQLIGLVIYAIAGDTEERKRKRVKDVIVARNATTFSELIAEQVWRQEKQDEDVMHTLNRKI